METEKKKNERKKSIAHPTTINHYTLYIYTSEYMKAWQPLHVNNYDYYSKTLSSIAYNDVNKNSICFEWANFNY